MLKCFLVMFALYFTHLKILVPFEDSMYMQLFCNILLEFLNGIWDSLQGFWIFYRLESATPKPIVQPSGRTVLETRRLQRIGEVPIVETEKKTPREKLRPRERLARVCFLLLLKVFKMAFINLGLIAIYKFVNYCMENLFHNNFILSMILNPVFHIFLCLIRFLSLLWFSELANAAIAYRAFKPPNTVSISHHISAFANIFVVQMSYVCTSELLLWINTWPLLCQIIYFLMNAELNSLYCFDYIWIARELGVTQKLTMIERRWAYHLGFGFLLTLPILMCSSIVSGSIFGILFPFFIISSVLTDATGPEMCASKNCRSSKVPPIPIFFTTQLISKRFSRFFASGISRLLGGDPRKIEP